MPVITCKNDTKNATLSGTLPLEMYIIKFIFKVISFLQTLLSRSL